MKVGDYEVEPKYVNSDGVIAWKVTGSGSYVIGKKNGKRWFIKRNDSVRKPVRADLPPASYELLLKSFTALRHKQLDMQRAMSDLTTERDHIVIEADIFDESNYLVVVTQFMEGLHKFDGDFMKGSSFNQMLPLFTEMANEIAKLHARGIIHSDLKTENIVCCDEGGKLVPYTIDFDISFPVGKVPDWQRIGGTDGYLSPEVTQYMNNEGGVTEKDITPAIDVFGLAMTMYRYWFGHFPDCGDYESCADMVLDGKPLKFDPKCDAEIPGAGIKFSELLSRMTEADYKKRITAQEVFATLSGKEAKPARRCDVCAPWDEDGILFSSASDFLAKGYAKVERGSGSGKYRVSKYEADDKIGAAVEITAKDLIDQGLARIDPSKKKPCELCEPWPEDGITFEPAAKFSAKGYVKVERSAKGKGWYLCTKERRDGTLEAPVDKMVGMIVFEGLAKKAGGPTPGVRPKTCSLCAPWPGDNVTFASSSDFLAKGYARVDRGTASGKYRVSKYGADDRPGPTAEITIADLKAEGLAKEKVAGPCVLCEPWPEDKIEFVDAKEFSAKGYTRIDRSAAGRGQYRYTKVGGFSFDISVSELKRLGLAKAKDAPAPAPTGSVETDGAPYPEDGSAYNEATLAARKVLKIRKAAMEDGSRAYVLTYAEGDRLIRANNVLFMGFIKK